MHLVQGAIAKAFTVTTETLARHTFGGVKMNGNDTHNSEFWPKACQRIGKTLFFFCTSKLLTEVVLT